MTRTNIRPAICEACRLMRPVGRMTATHFIEVEVTQSNTPESDGWAIVRNKKLHVLAEPVWVCAACKDEYETVNPTTP